VTRGDVKFLGIDGTVVKIELCGNCVSCSSSSITVKVGIERKMKERIPSVTRVEHMQPDAPEVNEENLEKVLSGVRPFLSIAGGDVSVKNISKMGSGFPTVITLKMEGGTAALFTVKVEIVQRIEQFFKQPLNIQWEN
jgi:Fe-S cluster biogenesis protein NfuA